MTFFSPTSSPTRRTALLLGLAPVLAACSPSLETFNSITPKDDHTRVARRNVRFGPERRHTLDVYAPEEAVENAPVMAFFYGGGWMWGDKDEYEFVGRAFAAQGFVTVVPNYRLAPHVHFPAFVEDCALALKWIAENIARHGGDPKRLALSGHSAGAYNAVMLALDPRFAEAAGFDLGAVKGVAAMAGPYDFLPLRHDFTIQAFSGAPDLEETQPARFARAGAPPLLLMWGAKDDLVGRQNIETLERAMREAGGAVESKIYPDLNHGEILLALSVPLRDIAPVLQDIVDFAKRVTASG